MTVIGLWGYAGSGKDEVGRFLVREHSFTRVGFADKLREMAYALDPICDPGPDDDMPLRLSDLVDRAGWEVAKSHPEVRRLLQRIGTEAGRRVLGKDVWVRAAMSRVDALTRCVITDVRFTNEATAVKERDGFMVRVHRPGVLAINGHESETQLESWPFDATIWNDGALHKLGDRVEAVMERLGIL